MSNHVKCLLIQSAISVMHVEWNKSDFAQSKFCIRRMIGILLSSCMIRILTGLGIHGVADSIWVLFKDEQFV